MNIEDKYVSVDESPIPEDIVYDLFMIFLLGLKGGSNPESGKVRGMYGWRVTENAEEVYTDALMRHVKRFGNGEAIDEDSGLPTLLHVAANVLILEDLRRCREVEDELMSLSAGLSEERIRKLEKAAEEEETNFGYDVWCGGPDYEDDDEDTPSGELLN